MRRFFFVLLAVLAAITVLSAAGIYWGSGWSQINCWTREINIRTGHQRYTRYWFWRVTEQHIDPTWISDALSCPRPPAVDENWHLVVTLSPGTGHSPHYIFHGALSDLQGLQQLDALVSSDQDSKRTLATSVVWLWQTFGHDSEASDYISDVCNAALKTDHLGPKEIPPLKSWLESRRKKLAPTDGNSYYAKTLDAVITSAAFPASPCKPPVSSAPTSVPPPSP